MYLISHSGVSNYFILDDDYDTDELKNHLLKLLCKFRESQKALVR